MELDIVVQNIKCSGDSSGYILINNIIAASGIETEIFSNGYSVVWVTGEVLVSSTGLFPSPILIQGVDPEKISENSIFAGGLEAGTYGARIITSGIVSSTGLANAFNRSLDSIFYYSSSVVPIEVAGNSTLEINDIIINNPCSAPASIDVDYSGGLSPYSISYGLNFSTETGNLASITGLTKIDDVLHRVIDKKWSKVAKPDVSIEYSREDALLTFKINPLLKTIEWQGDQDMVFLITEYNDPNVLQEMISFNVNELVKYPQRFTLTLPEKFSIYTRRIFDKYTYEDS